MKITLRYKGGSGSGNYGHAGRPGKVGGSSKRTITYSSIADAIEQYPDKESYYVELIMAPNGDVVGMDPEGGAGGHAKIARKMIASKKYAQYITKKNVHKHAPDTHLVVNGFVRVLLYRYASAPMELSLEVAELNNSLLRKLQRSLDSNLKLKSVFIEAHNRFSGNMPVPFHEFMAATKVTVRDNQIELKEKKFS